MRNLVQKLLSIAIIATFVIAASACGNKGPLARPAAVSPEVNSIEIEDFSLLS